MNHPIIRKYLPSLNTVVVICFMMIISILSTAQNSKDNLQKTKKQLEDEIKYTNSLLEQTKKTKQNSLNKINILTKQIEKRESLIETVNKEIDEIQTDIEVQDIHISKLDNELRRMKDEYARMIYYAYKNMNAYNRLMFIFSAADFNQAFYRLRYYQQYSAYRRKQAELITGLQTELARQKGELENKKGTKTTLVLTKEQEKSRLTQEKQDKDKSVKELSQKEKQLMATLKQKQQAADKLQKEIEKLIAEEIKAAAARAKKSVAKEPKTKMENTKTDIMLTPVERELSSSFASNRGKLPWPLEKGIVTGAFGEHAHPVLKYVKVRNNGIDISTVKSAGARAVFKGKVSRVMSFPNLNNVVIIRHGEYLTVYSNLETVLVKDGQDVSTKQIIGTVHTNTDDSKTELHFEIWLGKAIQNPQEWLSRTN